MVKAEDSQSRGRGFESQHRILDGLKENGENKGSQMGQTAKKRLEKKIAKVPYKWISFRNHNDWWCLTSRKVVGQNAK